MIGGEPYFKYWRFVALDNGGAVNVRIDDLQLLGRDNGPDLLRSAIGETYSGGFAEDDLIAPVANLPSVTYEFMYPVAARKIDVDFNPTPEYMPGPFSRFTYDGVAVDITTIAYSPSLQRYVAAGTNNRVKYSDDFALSWGSSTWGSPSLTNPRLSWSEKLQIFVAVGGATSTNPRIKTSIDGITWTSVVSMNAHSFRGIVWSPELETFVAVTTTLAANVFTSSDGINWILRNAPASSLQSVYWVPELGLFWAGGGNNNSVIYSSDAVNWNSRSNISAAGSAAWVACAYSSQSGMLVFGQSSTGSANNKFVYSHDSGVSWTTVDAPYGITASVNSIAYSQELNLFYIWFSQTGVDWDFITTPDFVTYSKGQYVGNTISNGFGAYFPERQEFIASGLNNTGARMTIQVDGGDPTEGPTRLRIDVSNNNREYFTLGEIGDISWS